MATCVVCGKKVNKYLSNCNVYDGGLICGDCDGKRKVGEKIHIQYDVDTKYDTFGQRFMAAILDGLVFIPVSFLDRWIWANSETTPISLVIAWFIFNSFSIYTYSVLMHGYFGQTLGKMFCRVKVLDVSEEVLTMKQALLRDIVPIILTSTFIFLTIPDLEQGMNLYDTKTFSELNRSMLFSFYISVGWFLAEIITMLTNKKRRAVHDFIAGSVVIRWSKKKDMY